MPKDKKGPLQIEIDAELEYIKNNKAKQQENYNKKFSELYKTGERSRTALFKALMLHYTKSTKSWGRSHEALVTLVTQNQNGIESILGVVNQYIESYKLKKGKELDKNSDLVGLMRAFFVNYPHLEKYIKDKTCHALCTGVLTHEAFVALKKEKSKIANKEEGIAVHKDIKSGVGGAEPAVTMRVIHKAPAPPSKQKAVTPGGIGLNNPAPAAGSVTAAPNPTPASNVDVKSSVPPSASLVKK